MSEKNRGLSRFGLLTRRQQLVFAVIFTAGFIMVLNTLYLLFASHVAGIGTNPEVLPVFYQLMLVLHLALGSAFALLGLFFAVSHVRRIFKMRRHRPWMRVSGLFFIASMALLGISGLFILSESNSRENFWVFVSHQVLAMALVGSYLAHRLLSRVKPEWPVRLGIFWSRIFKTAGKNGATPVPATTVVVLCLLIVIAQAAVDSRAGPRASETAPAENANVSAYKPATVGGDTEASAIIPEAYRFVAAGDPDADSPFFPATTTTSTGGLLPARIITHDDLPDLEAFRQETMEKGFAPSYYLGAQSCARCHADIVQQWSTSAHRFSSFNNPFYRKSVELTRQKISKKASQFCGGCHDPAVMLAGNMVKEIDPLTPESQAGLTCLGCHAIDEVHGVVGNGNYNIHDKTESPYIFDQAKMGLGQEIHDYVLKAKPTVHKRRNLKPIFHKSEFCMSCHKVNLDVEVNNYRWLRGQNEYDAWHNSGVARNQPRTWYEPPTVRQCQDCHMPYEEAVLGDFAADNGLVRSHRFLSVNTALPALRGDTDTIRRMEEFLRDEKLRLEIFAIRRESGELIMSARDNEVYVSPGETIQVDVVVRNLNVGHTFPGGTNDSNEGWIDFKVSAGDDVVFHNGYLGQDRHVDPAAHFYKAVLVDRHGERIAKRNASDIYATVYANVIAPSTSDIARYKFKVPDDAAARELTINARLMWRKFNREFTEFVFEDGEIPDLPITEIETDLVTLSVSEWGATQAIRPVKDDEKRWMRYNDYGIGSVLDGDTRTALAAFAEVAQLVPEKMDGYLNQARAHLSEGSLDKAEYFLRQASTKAPNEARLAFFWGMLLEKKGRLTEAVEAYRRTLQSYPESRDTLVRLGRVYWLDSQYQSSIDMYKRVLTIDPEHALAFHQLHLAYKALAANATDAEEKHRYAAIAGEYQKGFEKYKTDENAAAVTHSYRERHPYDNLMSQSIIVHEEG